jgi:copper chaperone for superoxide dismutase
MCIAPEMLAVRSSFEIGNPSLNGLSSGADCTRCGPVLESGGQLATIVADANGRARLQLEAPLITVDDIIGRSVVVRNAAAEAAVEQQRVACAVVARSAGVAQNPKRICACDGSTIWESKP